MRKGIKIVIAVILIAVLFVVLTIPKLYAVSMGNNLAFGASGEMADVQTFVLHPGTQFSATFAAYPANTSIVLLSIRSPDGAFVLKNHSLVYEEPYSFSFVANQSGQYKFIFANPYPSMGSTVAANITFHEPLIYPYQPQNQKGAGNVQVPMSQLEIES